MERPKVYILHCPSVWEVLPLPAPKDKAALQAQVTFTLISTKNKAQTIFTFLSEIWIVSRSKARDPEFGSTTMAKSGFFCRKKCPRLAVASIRGHPDLRCSSCRFYYAHKASLKEHVQFCLIHCCGSGMFLLAPNVYVSGSGSDPDPPH